MTLELGWSAATHVGLVRTLNEDSVLAEPPVFAVADGMGGHVAGEVASALAVERLRALAARGTITQPDVLEAIRQAHADITAAAVDAPGERGMGTTLAALAVTVADGAPALLVANVGDSRVYRLRDGALVQVSVDHSVTSELVRSGELTETQAAVDPRRHMITRALGSQAGVAVDAWTVAPQAGDRYLLCSDGLSNEVEHAALLAALVQLPDPAVAADLLIDAALRAGGRDNVSAVVVDVLSVSSDTALDDTSPAEPLATGAA